MWLGGEGGKVGKSKMEREGGKETGDGGKKDRTGGGKEGSWGRGEMEVRKGGRALAQFFLPHTTNQSMMESLLL